MLQTNNNSKPVQGQERDPPLQPRSSALRGCSACPGIRLQFNLLDRPQQCGIDPKKLTMWQGKHLRHQGVEGLAVRNGPHPICKEWHWVKDFQGRQLMSFVLLLKKNRTTRQDKIVPEDMMVLIAIPTPRPDRAKRGSSTNSMYLLMAKPLFLNLDWCMKILQTSQSCLLLFIIENLTSQSCCRNGKRRGSETAL